MNKTMIYAALALTFGVVSVSAQAATLNAGDMLSITAGVTSYDTNSNVANVTVSWFGLDTNGNGAISNYEKTALSQGATGIVIGTTSSPGASHSGIVAPGDTNAITAPWDFFYNTGSDYVTTPITGGTTGLNFSGWTVSWNGIPSLNLGGNAWGTGYASGIANFSWDGAYGHAYTLDYHAAIPQDDPSGFGGLKYALHLEGTAEPVPLPSAAWLLGSGLVGLVGVARKRKAA